VKSFQHLRFLGGLKTSRKTLRAYSIYRSYCSVPSLRETALTMECLINFHVYESLGKFPDGIKTFTEFTKSNGYAYGKWQAALVQDMILEDLRLGYFCKADFFNTSHHFECHHGYTIKDYIKKSKSRKLRVLSQFENTKFSYSRANWYISNYLKNIPSYAITPCF
jgi:hypothetical protein